MGAAIHIKIVRMESKNDSVFSRMEILTFLDCLIEIEKWFLSIKGRHIIDLYFLLG